MSNIRMHKKEHQSRVERRGSGRDDTSDLQIYENSEVSGRWWCGRSPVDTLEGRTARINMTAARVSLASVLISAIISVLLAHGWIPSGDAKRSEDAPRPVVNIYNYNVVMPNAFSEPIKGGSVK